MHLASNKIPTGAVFERSVAFVPSLIVHWARFALAVGRVRIVWWGWCTRIVSPLDLQTPHHGHCTHIPVAVDDPGFKQRISYHVTYRENGLVATFASRGHGLWV